MTYQYKSISLASVAALAVGATLTFAPMKAEAAGIYATSIEMITDGPRGTEDNRDIMNNAIDGNPNTFFELGFGGVFEFQFGSPSGQKFFGPGSVIEITNGSTLNWPEAVEIQVGTKGGAFFDAAPKPFTNSDTTFTFSGGPFDTVRLTDVTTSQTGFRTVTVDGVATGGFDVASISVTPVPLPASALLLLGGLGGLGGLSALRRRKRTA